MQAYFRMALIAGLLISSGSVVNHCAEAKSVSKPATSKATQNNDVLLPLRDPIQTNHSALADSYIQGIAQTTQITLFKKGRPTPYLLNQLNFKNGILESNSPVITRFPKTELESLFLEYPLEYPMQAQQLPLFQLNEKTATPLAEIQAASTDFQIQDNQVFLKPELQKRLLRQFIQAKQKAGIADQTLCNAKNRCMLLRLNEIKPGKARTQFQLTFKTIALSLTQQPRHSGGSALNKGQQ
jgi:hypothetical protein